MVSAAHDPMDPRPDHAHPGEPGIRHAPHSDAEGRHYAEAIVDTIREALLVLTPDLRVQTANARFYEVFETRPDETEGCLVYELGGGQWDLPELRRLLEEILPQDSVVEGYEVAHAFEGLGERVVRLNARRLDHLQLILLAIEDITALRRAERERREAREVLGQSEERYRLLVEGVREYAIFSMDPERRITTWNSGAALITGYAEGEVLGRSGDLLFTEEDRAAGAPEAEAATALAEGQAADDRWHVRKDDSRFWASGITTPLRAPGGRLRGFAKVLRDNTERKRAEEALLRSRDTFLNLIQNAPFGVYLVDAGFRLAQVSAGAQKVFSTVRPLLGRDFAEVLRIIWPEPFATEAIGRFRHTLETGESYHAADTTERRADVDEVESYDWQIERVTLPDGQFGVVCYFYDLTELRRAEAAVRRLNETLEARVAERTREVRALAAQLTAAEQAERHRLAEVLHDDLQQQLFGLAVLLNLLPGAATPEEQRELHVRATQTLAEATTLTRTLATELSPPVLTSNRLGDLLRWLAERKRTVHGLDVDVEVDEPCVVPDPDARVLLYRVLKEVLFNVVKHAGTDRARVRAWTERTRIVVRVEDEGAGFDPRALDARGAGEDSFGLASMRERLKLVGGHFEVDAAPGRGTRVIVVVPLGAGET